MIVKQISDRLGAAPRCVNYKGTECGPMCTCAPMDEARAILDGYYSDILVIAWIAATVGFTFGWGLAWWVFL
jgi:hypothetical protein